MKLKSPRILFYDIETAQNLVAVFGLANNDWIDPSNIIRERYVISVAWKWSDESQVHSVSVLDNPKLYKSDPFNDLHVITTFHKVMTEADVLVGHNSDSFDKRWLDTRALVHGLDPLPPIPSLDTYKVAKSKFYLNSNKLDYIGKLLKVGQKKHTTTGLWMRVLQGDQKAVQEMVDYNKQDVILLEKVFLKLRPYMNNHINRELFGKIGCPRCGSTKIQSRGLHRAISRNYQRYQCQACKGWFKGSTQVGTTTKTRVI